MARRDDRTVVFVIESGATKIDQSHVRPFDPPVVPFLSMFAR